MDFWSLSTTYHNTQAVLTIRCAVASAFVGYCFRDSSPTTRKVDCITVHYTLLPILFVPILSATIRTLLLFACYSSPTSWLVRERTRYKVYSIRGRTIHPRLSLFHAPARLSYCPSRQFIHMAALLSYLLHHFSWCSPLRYFYSHGVRVCLASYPPNTFLAVYIVSNYSVQ